MGIVLKAQLGPRKAKTKADILSQIVNGSEMFVTVLPGKDCPELIYIEIHGILAQIPSLKNGSHIFGGIDKRTLCALLAMDQLFIDEVVRQGYKRDNLSFGTQMVHITLTAAGRKTANEDNAITTIKDWLEPHSKAVGRKNKRDRGWGIGLIQDDIQARGYALKTTDTPVKRDYTTIAIRPWDDVKARAIKFITDCEQICSLTKGTI